MILGISFDIALFFKKKYIRVAFNKPEYSPFFAYRIMLISSPISSSQLPISMLNSGNMIPWSCLLVLTLKVLVLPRSLRTLNNVYSKLLTYIWEKSIYCLIAWDFCAMREYVSFSFDFKADKSRALRVISLKSPENSSK
jgi:hypothetical protein